MVTGAPKDLRRLALAGGAFLVLACGHTEPFSTPPYGTTQPFDPTPPVRLTLNHGPDRGASWLPDGSGILYSAQQLGRGMTRTCAWPSFPRQAAPSAGWSAIWLERGATARRTPSSRRGRGPDGRLAFVKVERDDRRAPAPSMRALSRRTGVGCLRTRVEVQGMPYTVARRADPQRRPPAPLAGRPTGWSTSAAVRPLPRRRAQFCPIDTIVTGLEVALLDLSAAGASPAVSRARTSPPGVSPGATSDEMYYTLDGDTRVYRRVALDRATERGARFRRRPASRVTCTSQADG